MALGIVAYPERQRAIQVIPFLTEQLVAVFAKDHPLAGKKTIDAAALDGERFVAFEPDIPTRRHTDKRLKAERIKVQIAMEFDNNETLKRAVEIGAGISILPQSVVEREVAARTLTFARFRNPRQWVRPLGVLRPRGKAPTPAESKFLGLLRAGASGKDRPR